MSEATDNPYPVDPTGPPSIRSTPEENLGPLFDATDDRRFDIDTTHTLHELAVFASPTQVRIRSMWCGELEDAERNSISLTIDEARQLAEALRTAMVPSLERLRQAVAEVQPRDLTGVDVRGIVELIKAALDSDSQWADRVRADEAVRMRPVDLDATSPKALAEVITRSLDDLDKAIAHATRLGVPLPGLSPGDARAAEVAVNTRRRFTGSIESGE